MPTPVAEIEPRYLSDDLRGLLRMLLRDRYAYLTPEDNPLAPACVAATYPRLLEGYDFAWISRFLPGSIRAWSNFLLKRAQILAQQAVGSFDPMRAHDQLFYDGPPAFARHFDDDEAFAYRRVAGPNAVEIRRVQDFKALRERIPLSATKIARGIGRRVSLARAVDEGRLYMVDFERLMCALRGPRGSDMRDFGRRGLTRQRMRDSRWRQKYLPAPIGVFLEDSEPWPRLRPLAIRIDQPQERRCEHNPVYHVGEGAGWKLAKFYFEVADHNAHFACWHLSRTHFVMEPFCLATARQLSFSHPVYLLLQPHTRYTLATNSAACQYFVDRRAIYSTFYAGTLEDSRQIFKMSCAPFKDLDLLTDLRARDVVRTPHDYPFRDDSLLWRDPIERFVRTYVGAFYTRDAQVQTDRELQAWATELMAQDGGNLQGLVADDRLDTVEKLVELLAQVLFIAGPGHAAQHFSEMYYYRYAPAFPAAAYAPPPWREERVTEARFLNTVPPIGPASLQFTFSQFGDFRFDRFGDYTAYPLARARGAAEPIRALQSDLDEVERVIRRRLSARPMPYDFLLPSRVPNSINI